MDRENNIIKQSLEKASKEKEQHKAEIEMILLRADENKEENFDFGDSGDIVPKNHLQEMLDEPLDNPEERYELYYKVVNRLLRKYLPKGRENEKARRIIYEEKNTFLTRGHRLGKNGIRKADGRMAYIPDLKELINIIVDWASTDKTMMGLYVKLRDLNISKGYGLSELEK